MVMRMTLAILWFLFACNSMRYNACDAVNIGEKCLADQEGQLECTRLPSSTVDADCVEHFLEDHIVAKCRKIGNHYEWRGYAACTDGLHCLTDGEDYQCEQSKIEDCQWDDGEFWDTGY